MASRRARRCRGARRDRPADARGASRADWRAIGALCDRARRHSHQPRGRLARTDRASVGGADLARQGRRAHRGHEVQTRRPCCSQKAPLASTPLAGYGRYYAALAAFRQNKLDEARQVASALVDSNPTGALAETSRRLAGEIAEAQNDSKAAVAFYEPLTKAVALAPDEAWSRLARARQASGDAGAPPRPTRTSTTSIRSAIWRRPRPRRLPRSTRGSRSSRDPRATSWNWAAPSGCSARSATRRRATAFALVQPAAVGRRPRARGLRARRVRLLPAPVRGARDALEPWTSTARRRAEAQFFYLVAARSSATTPSTCAWRNELVSAFPERRVGRGNAEQPRHVLHRQGSRTTAPTQTFRELRADFPQGRYAQRAQWKIGWTAYRTGRCDEAVADSSSRRPPRFRDPTSARRGSTGPPARASSSATASAADALYGIIVADYQNCTTAAWRRGGSRLARSSR